MKIVLTHTRFHPSGGQEQYLFRLVAHLLAGGHEVHFFARRAVPVANPRFVFHRVRCAPFPQELRILSFAHCSARALARTRADLSIGFGRTFGHDLHRDSSGAFDAFRHALGDSFHRSRLYCRVARHIERRLYAGPELRHTFTVSEFVRSQLRSRYALPEDRVSVLYNGVDVVSLDQEARHTLRAAVRLEVDLNGRRPVALFVGNDWRRKGLNAAVSSLARTQAPWELWVVGEDRHARQFRRLAAATGVAARVKFLGPRDTLRYYAAADVLLFPSRFDTMANVVLEAMASGLPVIVSPRDGAAELVQDARAGIVLDDPTDARGIARTLDGLVSPQTREAFAQRARSVAASLTWEKHFAQFDALMSSVIAQKNMGRAVPCVDMQPDMA